ncbi:hypothetical protein IQ260_08870 [Leptolyngbya cf. ectocarpi LEGE 11479]|uniref:Tetratricopeptide repeat protein n=1 Tax=Leptolyngbya cf. ectocarpi LEGE 11479 TaxID=1828722 RepID=A0A928ZRM3_LEPEC|nr:hypothetical protein [Leptolyngbya ectocarpi]MBE9066763.1 hypothetical protein [Leptolyngbya cf. ectocarpi LEGE 11479]
MEPTVSPSALHGAHGVKGVFQTYAQALLRLAQTPDTITKSQVLHLLLVRDAIDSQLRINRPIVQQANVLARLSDLDNQLQDLTPVLLKDGKLADCRRSRQPDKTAWWWWLETAEPESNNHKLDRFDWLWNVLSASSLVVSASFLTITAQAFSVVGGFDLIQTVSTLSQATGLVLIAGGTLTNRGQRLVKKTLKKLNIPPYFHSEVTLIASIFLLLASYGVYNALPQFSDYYYSKGLKAQQSGNLYVAVEYYKEAIAFNPEATEPHNHLAEVYQNLEKFQEAQAEYQDGLLKGDLVALNGMGTLSLAAADNDPSDAFGELSGLLDAEVLFRIGLDKVNDMDNLDSRQQFLKAALHRNLGITLMKRGQADDVSEKTQQRLLEEAAQHFQSSITVEKTIVSEETYAGQGVAYCYIAALNEQNGLTEEATENWQICQQAAYPASLEQYEDILRLGAGAVGLQLDTQYILESNIDGQLHDGE